MSLAAEKSTLFFFDSGRTYSSGCRSYSEDGVYLQCGDMVFLIAASGEDYVRHQLVCQPLDEIQSKCLKRRLKHSGFTVDEIQKRHDGTVWAVRLSSAEKYLYLLATEFRGVKFMLESKPIENIQELHYYSCGEKIEFINKRLSV